MPRTPKPAQVGPWAKEKLEALQRYLDYYTKVLKNQPWRTIYLDAFAGGGTAVVRGSGPQPSEQARLIPPDTDPEQQEFIRGSPRIALELANPFSTYVFVDASGARIAELKAIKEEYEERRNIHVREGLAEEEIRWVLSQNIKRSTYRGVAFLDPFGAHLGWTIIQTLARTGLFEVLINFPLHMAIARLMKNDADIPATWRAQLDNFFGSSDWVDDVYVIKTDLLGMSTTTKRADYMDRLLQRYRGQLRRAFGYVSTPKLIKNTRNSPLYYLLWAGPNKKGLQGADYVLGMDQRLPSGARGGRPQ